MSFITKLQKRLAEEERLHAHRAPRRARSSSASCSRSPSRRTSASRIAPSQKAAAANVRSAIPAAEAYYSDNGNYTDMDLTTGDAPDAGGLQGIDSGLSSALSVPTHTATGYCLEATVNTHTSLVVGPGGTVVADNGPCP